MKKFLNLAFAFVATMILFSSCDKDSTFDPEKDNTVNFTPAKFTGGHMSIGKSGFYIVMLSDEKDVHSYVLTLYNKLGEVDDNGNVTIPSGTYTLAAGGEDYSIAPHSQYTDKSEGAENTKTVQFTEATAVVSENKLVLTAVIEGVKHVVTYNGPLSMRADLPEPDVDFVANHAYAYYAGTTSEENVAEFKLFLSDIGRGENGNILPNGSYYRLTLCVEKLNSNAEIAIPAGRYEISMTSSAVGYATNAMYYKYGENASEAIESNVITSGYITVNEDGSIEASLDMSNGATHTITFTGDVDILENTMPSEAPYSTLTSDRVCDLSNHSFSCYYNEKSYGDGYQSWTVSIYNEKSVGDNIVLEILCGTDMNADISGKYTISNSLDEYTAFPGYVDGFTLMSSWYYYRENALNISEYAPIVDGWVEIQKNDEGTYTITFDVYDDLNNNITGSTNVTPFMESAASQPAINL